MPSSSRILRLCEVDMWLCLRATLQLRILNLALDWLAVWTSHRNRDAEPAKPRLANKRWAGKEASEKERAGSRFTSYLHPIGQGRTIALSLRHSMKGTNILTYPLPEPEALGKLVPPAFWEPWQLWSFCWRLKKCNHCSFNQTTLIGDYVQVLFLKVELVKYLLCCLCKDSQLYSILKGPLSHVCLITELPFFRLLKGLDP